MEKYKIRKIEKSDFNKKYLKLLSQLTNVGKITREQFNESFDNIGDNKDIYVIENLKTKKLIGTGSIIYEQKFIHNCARYAYIEDIVISCFYRRKNYGRILIHHLLNKAEENKCSKVILRTKRRNVLFYEKSKFKVYLEDFIMKREL